MLGTSLPGVESGDTVTLVVTDPKFDTKNVGNDKDVTGALSLDGAQAGNYALTSATHTAKANITHSSVNAISAAEAA